MNEKTKLGNWQVSPWLSTFQPKVLGELRPLINQYSDLSGNTLTPKKLPKLAVDPATTPTLPEEEPPVCIPADVNGVSVSPVNNPLVLGTEYTFSAVGVTGTAPIFYIWFFNGSEVGTGTTFVHTLVDGDVLNKDAFGLGQIFIFVVVGNACGIDATPTSGTVPAQGTPP